MTDGRDVLSIPASAVHAMTALGWTTVEEPSPAPRSRARAKK